MTKEEAIKLLEHISVAYTPTDAYGDYDDPQPYEEALDMAIESLHREEAEAKGYCHRIRPQGEWIDKDGELVCSVCGNSVSFTRTPNGWVLGKFCQSCGTRMKGENNEID